MEIQEVANGTPFTFIDDALSCDAFVAQMDPEKGITLHALDAEKIKAFYGKLGNGRNEAEIFCINFDVPSTAYKTSVRERYQRCLNMISTGVFNVQKYESEAGCSQFRGEIGPCAFNK